MPITNYSELCRSVADWLARGDLTNVIPDFVTLAEARLRNRLMGVAFEADATLITDPGAVDPRKVALPAGLAEPIRLDLVEAASITPLLWQTSSSMRYNVAPGRPLAWCVNGSSIDLDSPADGAYTLNLHYRWDFGLSEASPTNWLLTNSPAAYLAATLVEAYLYIKNPEGAAVWDQRASEHIDGLNDMLARSKSGALLTVEAGLVRSGYSMASLMSGQF